MNSEAKHVLALIEQVRSGPLGWEYFSLSTDQIFLS